MKNNTHKKTKETALLPSLRVAFKSGELEETIDHGANKTDNMSLVDVRPIIQQPLPLFNDYKFKARDHDPL